MTIFARLFSSPFPAKVFGPHKSDSPSQNLVSPVSHFFQTLSSLLCLDTRNCVPLLRRGPPFFPKNEPGAVPPSVHLRSSGASLRVLLPVVVFSFLRGDRRLAFPPAHLFLTDGAPALPIHALFFFPFQLFIPRTKNVSSQNPPFLSFLAIWWWGAVFPDRESDVLFPSSPFFGTLLGLHFFLVISFRPFRRFSDFFPMTVLIDRPTIVPACT